MSVAHGGRLLADRQTHEQRERTGMSDVSDMITAARKGQLAHNDQRLQTLMLQADRGAPQAQVDLDAIREAGGWHSGSVNGVV